MVLMPSEGNSLGRLWPFLGGGVVGGGTYCPHSLQWCRRVKTVKVLLHCVHSFEESSRTHPKPNEDSSELSTLSHSESPRRLPKGSSLVASSLIFALFFVVLLQSKVSSCEVL